MRPKIISAANYSYTLIGRPWNGLTGDFLTVCPLDFRYGRKEMLSVFDEQAKLQAMLEVESALAQAEARYGMIPKDAAKSIDKAVSSGAVKLERVKEIEAEIGHDTMAMVRALSEVSDKGAAYVHFGATSNDVVDTATAIQLKKAIKIIKADLVQLETTLAIRALEERDTLMLGRTHGQSALPITFGLKLAVFLSEVDRQLERIDESEKRITVGKLSGAVGTGASMGKTFFDLQEDVMERLQIKLELASGQIVGRDRYAEFVSILSNIAATLEKMATEVRNLQRSEIDEVEEWFDTSKQVGSSTMAQKRNPIKAENICGLARIVRGFVTPSFENMILWHERDLTNSSAERLILPHVCVLIDDILSKTNDLFSNLAVHKYNMLRNIERAKNVIMAERVMLRLTDAMGRQNAHEAVRKAAMKTTEDGVPFADSLLSNGEIAKAITKEELATLLDPSTYVGHASEIVDTLVTQVKNQRALSLTK